MLISDDKEEGKLKITRLSTAPAEGDATIRAMQDDGEDEVVMEMVRISYSGLL